MYYSNEPAMGSGREKIIDLFCLKHKKHNKLAPSRGGINTQILYLSKKKMHSK